VTGRDAGDTTFERGPDLGGFDDLLGGAVLDDRRTGDAVGHDLGVAVRRSNFGHPGELGTRVDRARKTGRLWDRRWEGRGVQSLEWIRFVRQHVFGR
jgi:hypothetical protein